jgi:hypothetical protein
MFHKWSASEQDYGGVEGTCKGWVFYNPITTDVFTYPTFTQRKQYETIKVNAKDASLFEMDPTIAYRINPEKACDIFTKYRVGIKELEDGYIRTCIYEAYRTCANQYTSDSLMSNRANFERDVRQRLEKSLLAEGFVVEEFTSKINPPKSLETMIDAKNAAVDEVVVTGSLAVTDCDQVLLTSNLEKGVIQVELYKTADEQSIDEVPDIPDEDPVMTFNANDTDSMSGTVEPGSYLVKAIVSEKATGTVKIEAILADCSNGGSK